MKNTYKTFWKKYSDFKYECNVGDFWKIMLTHFIVYTALFITLIIGVGIRHSNGTGMTDDILIMGSIYLTTLYFLLTFLPTLTITIRRLNNAGLHWGTLFLFLIPYAGPFILAYCLTLPDKATRMSYRFR
ncbi:DUF805 domain-containing protein [Lactococcus formosensis]|uniref:DUF805 domain-containing protein n=1 Tax=Lactococcus formosensis TaxID=1281486 RepID=UPI0024357475|nr:DUF805 domain-containing protein [Lactococcus formosensis]MDG6125118.1 DUF805 domain-containing protein [Lactococcus formosensis]MDG6148816.1 DUF805 domain-containing protein [Lactococcus formosensis]